MSEERPVLPQRIPGEMLTVLDTVHMGQLGALDLLAAGLLAAELPHAGTPIYDETVAALADPLTAPIPEEETHAADPR